MVRSRIAIAAGIHIGAFAANFALMRWAEDRLGLYRIMHGPANDLTNGLTLGLGATYALALMALAVIALRDTRHPVQGQVARTALVTTTTLAQIALGFLITGLGMISAAGGIPQG